jgi:hypothetical protein
MAGNYPGESVRGESLWGTGKYPKGGPGRSRALARRSRAGVGGHYVCTRSPCHWSSVTVSLHTLVTNVPVGLPTLVTNRLKSKGTLLQLFSARGLLSC